MPWRRPLRGKLWRKCGKGGSVVRMRELTRIGIAAVFSSVLGCLPVKSGDSHCVVVEDESHYTGAWLKHSTAKQSSRIPTEKCKALDQKIDDGDGEKKGKVRWIECLKGPDCEEPAMR